MPLRRLKQVDFVLINMLDQYHMGVFKVPYTRLGIKEEIGMADHGSKASQPVSQKLEACPSVRTVTKQLTGETV